MYTVVLCLRWSVIKSNQIFRFVFKFQDYDEEEDFYADILKDDIIKLDETSLPATPNLLSLVASKVESLTLPHQPADFIMSQALPLWTTQYQGLANRRLKQKQPATTSAPTEKENQQEKNEEPPETPNSEKRSTCVFGLVPVKKSARRHIIIIAFGVGQSLLVLLLSLLGGSHHVKRSIRSAVYKAFKLLA